MRGRDRRVSAARSAGRPIHKVTALTLGLVVALLTGEGIARLAERRAAGNPASDSAARLPPSARPEPRTRRGDFRILVVGDSFTDGGGLLEGEPYPHRLAALLSERYGPEAFEVLTVADSGLNTELEYELARPWVTDLSPELVVLGMCLNDPESSQPELQRQVLFAAGWRDTHPASEAAAYRSSAVVRLVVDRFVEQSARRSLRRYYASWYDEDLPSWKEFVRALRKFRRISRKNGAALVVVVFPIFDSPLDHRYPYRDLHARITRLAASLRIPTLDLLPAYDGWDAEDLAVVPFTDPHPNALAHRIAAESILEYLLGMGLLSEPSSPPSPEANPRANPPDPAGGHSR